VRECRLAQRREVPDDTALPVVRGPVRHCHGVEDSLRDRVDEVILVGHVPVPNDPSEIAAAVAEAGEGAEVIVEVTYGWYWVVDLLDAAGHSVR
jgi:hypothetical protein